MSLRFPAWMPSLENGVLLTEKKYRQRGRLDGVDVDSSFGYAESEVSIENLDGYFKQEAENTAGA